MLSIDKHVGLASCIVGDIVDIATLLPALRADNPTAAGPSWHWLP